MNAYIYVRWLGWEQHAAIQLPSQVVHYSGAGVMLSHTMARLWWEIASNAIIWMQSKRWNRQFNTPTLTGPTPVLCPSPIASCPARCMIPCTSNLLPTVSTNWIQRNADPEWWHRDQPGFGSSSCPPKRSANRAATDGWRRHFHCNHLLLQCHMPAGMKHDKTWKSYFEKFEKHPRLQAAKHSQCYHAATNKTRWYLLGLTKSCISERNDVKWWHKFLRSTPCARL